MPHFTLNIEENGPLLNVGFSVSEAREEALRKNGLDIPNIIPAKGLVDTKSRFQNIENPVSNRGFGTIVYNSHFVSNIFRNQTGWLRLFGTMDAWIWRG